MDDDVGQIDFGRDLVVRGKSGSCGWKHSLDPRNPPFSSMDPPSFGRWTRMLGNGGERKTRSKIVYKCLRSSCWSNTVTLPNLPVAVPADCGGCVYYSPQSRHHPSWVPSAVVRPLNVAQENDIVIMMTTAKVHPFGRLGLATLVSRSP